MSKPDAPKRRYGCLLPMDKVLSKRATEIAKQKRQETVNEKNTDRARGI